MLYRERKTRHVPYRFGWRLSNPTGCFYMILYLFTTILNTTLIHSLYLLNNFLSHLIAPRDSSSQLPFQIKLNGYHRVLYICTRILWVQVCAVSSFMIFSIEPRERNSTDYNMQIYQTATQMPITSWLLQ